VSPQRFTQVDAFTDRPFAGNPAAVCLLPSARDPVWMQQVAREMNLAETAFLLGRPDGFDLRWFTPTIEVDLCGHATLASAHVLWEEGRLKADEVARFHTRSGLLTAARRGDLIWLDFPSTPPESTTPPAEIERGLGVATRYVGRTAFDYLVEVDSEAQVRALAPDFAALARLGVRGVIVTARSSNGSCDFVSRFFAPGAGSTKIRSPDRPTAGWPRSGRPGWAGRNWSVIRFPRVVGLSG
jgi:PhzF family phenazine biosynthesis protein